MRVSTARSLELLAEAKSRGLPVTASVPWTHLVWDTSHLEHYDPNFHLDPPLGTPRDRRAAVAAVKSGILDAIATDHAPYTYEEKTVAFSEAPPGTIGLELAWTVLWQQLVVTGELTEMDLWRATSCNPATCLQQPPPRLERGRVAEAVLFDPRLTWKVDRRSLVSRSQNTPVLGETLTGRIRQVWCPSPQTSRTRD
jgi:dihydroorotase